MLLIPGELTHKFPREMEQAFRLRHAVFVEEKGWEQLRKSDQREIDQFDNENALHMLLINNDNLIGYQRLLPTTSPNLLSDVYPELCEGDLPNDTHIWEWTRFAVDKGHRSAGRKLSPAGNKLLSAIVEWGLQTGVHSIVIEMNPIWMLRLVQLYFKVTPLGFAQEIDGEDTLAVCAQFNERTLSRLREMRGSYDPVLKTTVA